MSLPIEVPLAKNSTLVIGIPGDDVAVALTVRGTPTVPAELLAGAVMETTGADPTTVIANGEDSLTFELLSVACAVSTYSFAADGVQVTEYGAVVSAAPIGSPSAKNVTLVTETSSVAFAETVTLPLAAMTSLDVGPVMLILGPFPTAGTTFTLMGFESSVSPLVNLTVATKV